MLPELEQIIDKKPLCEVLTVESKLLYGGTITAYNKQNGEIQVNSYRGADTPQGVVYETPVKLRLRAAKSNHLILVYGKVLRCAKDYWCIVMEDAVLVPEQREEFRQQTSVKGNVVLMLRDEPVENASVYPCQVVDISISGIRFQTKGIYREGNRVMVSGIQLRKGGQEYTFRCLLRRVTRPSPQSNGMWVYGCSFFSMSQREENQLGEDIFRLQAQGLSGK